MQFSAFSRGKSVRQLAYETLYRAICTGELTAGTRLVEEELAEQMHISRTPIREALRRLESEGLITHAPGKGASVVGFNRDDVIELYSIREALEALAIHYTIRHVTIEEITQLNAIVDKMRSNLHSKDVRAVSSNQINDMLMKPADLRQLSSALSSTPPLPPHCRIEGRC
jgi:DNA-binding GntR family transcriptional regulator